MPTSSGYQSLDFRQCKLKADGCNQITIGPLAHLVEHLICTEGVAGSNPVRSTIYLSISGANPLVREGLP